MSTRCFCVGYVLLAISGFAYVMAYVVTAICLGKTGEYVNFEHTFQLVGTQLSSRSSELFGSGAFMMALGSFLDMRKHKTSAGADASYRRTHGEEK
jgi:hypothetical protein